MYGSRTRRLLLPLSAGVCAIALVGGCSDSGSGSGSGSSSPSPSGSSSSDASSSSSGSGNDLQSDYQTTIKNVLPSVVQIVADSDLGSGIVYDDKGHIVTNAHVVGSSKTFQVTTATGSEQLTASLVYSYPDQDLAVIKLDKIPAGMQAAKFADSAKVDMGQIVLAMGSPLGLSSSVTQGIVSATGRTVSEGRSGGGTGATIGNMVQTSAAINPGNSGGALVNLDNQVIGIPTLAATDPDLGGSAAPGIGFAIPSSTVTTIADQIIKSGKVTDSGRAALGITARTVVDDDFQPAGVAVVSTTDGGAAAKAGLKAGDIITKLGDTGITTMNSLSEALASDAPGQKVQVTYERDGSSKTVEVTLGEM
ncbi:S1C family serine protease [Streptomyces beijiangensis]|uniref:Trypsin-like peptidase domain-containing protein n=1 Tax=Streptomyces beijiangensis TaxID=163361 RepID=A0A939JII0_9ACTN|nr:trypsin-like peptidase domain-containing protein [Streptomyces beijiangensis]MBO0513707.1 trypsin-like peptidase domain-containing protein [Streptomyces beijiangensis]